MTSFTKVVVLLTIVVICGNEAYVISKHESLREQGQAVVESVETKGSDDGPNPVMSLSGRSSSPLGSMIRNRNRRSSSIPETSSNKNITVEEHKEVVRHRPERMSDTKRILISLLATLAMPYLTITPSRHYYDYEDSSAVYTS